MKTELIAIISKIEECCCQPYKNQPDYYLAGEASSGDLMNAPETRSFGDFKIPVARNDFFAEKLLGKKLKITIETID